MSDNADQKAFWNDVAGPTWVANQVRLDRLMTPLTDVLLEIAAPDVGERVLDIGCGCGDLSLRLAKAVGTGGKVLGVDLSKPMLAAAAARSQRSSLSTRAPIAWLEADAMTHGFESVCDLLISRFGVMFFDDKPRAFANLRRALKPRGRFVFLAWRARAEVEWFQLPLEWLAPVFAMPDVTDGAVGPFGLADGEGTRALLEDSGFRKVVAEPLDRALSLGDGVEEAFTLLTNAGPVAALLREADPVLRREGERLLRANLRKVAYNGRVRMRGACWIYRGFA